MSQQQIEWLKKKMRNAVLHYRRELDNRGYDAGANIVAAMCQDVSKAARDVNDIAVKLKNIDPDFPADWKPYPTGI